jgi:hypothetical protein
MSHKIPWERLVEDEKDFLVSLGIELGPSSVTFTRELEWNEITLAFSFLNSLRKRNPDAAESYVNFAIGDCLVEMERLFGERRASQFIEEFPRLSALRDHILELAGGTLILLQGVEETLKRCCSLLELKGIKLSPADFLSPDPKRRKAMLGEMKSALIKTGAFSKTFESEFECFVANRNSFVHSLWIEDCREHSITGLPPAEHFDRMANFIRDLVRQAKSVERVFRGLMGALVEAIPDNVLCHHAQVSEINRWLRGRLKSK